MTRLSHATPLLLAALALTACPGDDAPADTEGNSTAGDTTDGTSVGPGTTPTTIDPDSGSDTSSSDGTTSDDPCAMVDCPPGEQCVGGICFDCGDPVCDAECAAGETCQCPQDDECCDMGACMPPFCGSPLLGGNYAACLEDGVASDAPCDGGGCVVDDPAGPSGGVCVTMGCDEVCQCPFAPPTGDAPVTCEDATGDDVNDCYLDCGGGDTCPNEMSCFGGFICLFVPPVVLPAYGDCADNPLSTCRAGEDTCLTDEAGTGGACSQAGCADAADCLLAPPTGDAPVTCGDLGGGTTCYLDCAAGETCPNGTTCTAVGTGSACLWPEDGFVLDEDFELEAFRPGWSVIDVDLQTPDPAVSFVNNAFVVTNEFEAANFGAYSTSWYAPVGQADDWLVTPQVTLGAASSLSWEGWAPDPNYADGYEVRVSTAGNTVMDFMANPAVFSIANEADDFTPHTVDLAAAGYLNQDVYIAFRNNSNDDFILVIDNVRVTQ